MNFAKVDIRCGQIKRLARQMFRGRWIAALVVMAVALAIANLPGFIIYSLFDSDVMSFIADIYALLVTGPVYLGLGKYFLTQFRGEDGAGLSNLAEGFGNFGRALLLYVLCVAKIMLWSFLLVIPGIIAAIRYSQAFYILADNPDMSPLMCIEMSKSMMRGNKGKFVLLVLSYLPLTILATLPSIIASYSYMDFSAVLTTEDYYNAVAAAQSQPLVTLLGLIPVIVSVYSAMGLACFYDIASGNLGFDYGPQMPLSRNAGATDGYEISGFSGEDDYRGGSY